MKPVSNKRGQWLLGLVLAISALAVGPVPVHAGLILQAKFDSNSRWGWFH